MWSRVHTLYVIAVEEKATVIHLFWANNCKAKAAP